MTIRELGNHIRRREASVEEVVRAAIMRTERLDPKLNSYITNVAEQALDSAVRADTEIRQGQYRGPLHGVPISIKDHLDTAGIPTTAGSKVLQKRVPQTDAIVVRKLKQAGAIIMGKANMNRFAGGGELNPDYGKTESPQPEFDCRFAALGRSGRCISSTRRRTGNGGSSASLQRQRVSLVQAEVRTRKHGRMARGATRPIMSAPH